MEHSFDERIVSDLHKDARGFRPRADWFAIWDAASNDEKQRIWDSLIEDLDEEMAREDERERLAAQRFETRVADTIELVVNSTREDAIRFIVQAEDCEDEEQLEWRLGLRFGYIKSKEMCNA